MGRVATKAVNNVWYEARLEASKYDSRLASREGASELLGMSVSAVSDAELGLTKFMPVDKAVLMADVYKAPQLLNYYCLHECPIHGCVSVSDEVSSIEHVTLRLLRQTKTEDLREIKEKLITIAEDGKIGKDEIDDLTDVEDYLDELCKTISEIKTLSRRARMRAEL